MFSKSLFAQQTADSFLGCFSGIVHCVIGSFLGALNSLAGCILGTLYGIAYSILGSLHGIAYSFLGSVNSIAGSVDSTLYSAFHCIVGSTSGIIQLIAGDTHQAQQLVNGLLTDALDELLGTLSHIAVGYLAHHFRDLGSIVLEELLSRLQILLGLLGIVLDEAQGFLLDVSHQCKESLAVAVLQQVAKGSRQVLHLTGSLSLRITRSWSLGLSKT